MFNVFFSNIAMVIGPTPPGTGVIAYAFSFIQDGVTVVKLNSEGLDDLVNRGIVDVERLKVVAWEESSGTPRLTITKLD